MGEFPPRGTVPVDELDVGRARRGGSVGNGAETVRQKVVAGQHRDDAGDLKRRRRVDAGNPRMGVRRAVHDRIDLTRQVDIVGETSASGQEPEIFLAGQRPANDRPCRWTRADSVRHQTINPRIPGSHRLRAGKMATIARRARSATKNGAIPLKMVLSGTSGAIPCSTKGMMPIGGVI